MFSEIPKKIVSHDQQKKELDKAIDDTLQRWHNECELPGDGHQILRWSRKGYLTRKQEKE